MTHVPAAERRIGRRRHRRRIFNRLRPRLRLRPGRHDSHHARRVRDRRRRIGFRRRLRKAFIRRQRGRRDLRKRGRLLHSLLKNNDNSVKIAVDRR